MATFVEDTKGEKMLAPSIEDVNEDPDELRSIRGQGRYFGETEDDTIKEPEAKCSNCSETGHFKRDCPHVICSYCGVMDDHYSQQCPTTMRCALCNESGHYRMHCPLKWKKLNCTLCNSPKHLRNRCPSVWRVYLLKNEDNERKVLPMHQIYCYNCGDKGHYGDECDKARSSRVPNDDGSAFSGKNLTSELRGQYTHNIDRQRSSQDMVSSVYDNLRSSQPIAYQVGSDRGSLLEDSDKQTDSNRPSRFSNTKIDTARLSKTPARYVQDRSSKNKRKFKDSLYDDGEDDEDEEDQLYKENSRHDNHKRSDRRSRYGNKKTNGNSGYNQQQSHFYRPPYQGYQSASYEQYPSQNSGYEHHSGILPTRTGVNVGATNTGHYQQQYYQNNSSTYPPQNMIYNQQVPMSAYAPPAPTPVKPSRSGVIKRYDE